MSDSAWMQRAIDLALRSDKEVKSNPKVGCVIVRENKIIGEGWHQFYGGPHAEVVACTDALEKGYENGNGCTVYVTLEPCGHHGKTPPCADLLAHFNPDRIVIGARDKNPTTSGKGLDILQKAGITIEFLALKDLGKLTDVFYTNIFQHRPYVICKWAETADGYIGFKDKRLKISNSISDRLVHRWRAEVDGILIGGNTLRIDDPQLSTRLVTGENAHRFVLTSMKNGDLEKYAIFNQEGVTTLLNPSTYKTIGDDFSWKALLEDLYTRHNVCRLLVEGGTYTIESLMKQDCIDEIRQITSDVFAGSTGIISPKVQGMEMYMQSRILNDTLRIFKKLSSKHHLKQLKIT